MALVPSIVILTGAGISAESGLQTFRASDGLWCDHRVEDVATPEAFRRNPGLVQGFYNQRRTQLKAVEPNAAHEALARLEAEWPGDFLLVTQNVDDLHDRARRVQGLLDRSSPSPRFFHMHGELKRVRCQRSGEVFAWEEDVLPETECACCRRVGSLRPDIVWFGEMPMHMEEIGDALRQCDLFLSIGTSGAVYPAAGFVHEAAIAGAHTVEINLEPTQRGSLFDEKIYGPASVEVVKYVERLMRQHHVV